MAQRSEQLRREAEQTRAQLADTLEELRTRITPGQVVDQLVDYAGDSGAGEFFRNLGRQAVNNPLPVTLMGAGLAWLMLAGKSPGNRTAGRMMERGRGLAGETADTLARWGSAARETSSELGARAADWAAQSAQAVRASAGNAAEKGQELADSISDAPDEAGSAAAAMSGAGSAHGSITDKAASAYGAMSEKAASAYETMSDKTASAYDEASEAAARAAAAARERAQAMTQSAADASRSFLDFCKEQPLVLAGIGLALGAVFGAALPGTKTEDELMGETSDQLKERAQSLAAEQYEKASAVAEHAYEGIKEEAEKQNLAVASELAQTAQEGVPTAPTLPEEPAGSEGGPVSEEPRHGQR
jgi:hypothetical protein